MEDKNKATTVCHRHEEQNVNPKALLFILVLQTDYSSFKLQFFLLLF